MKLAVPYNYDFSLIEKIVPNYCNYISELYLPAPSEIAGSCRPHKQPINYKKSISKIVEIMHKSNIKVNVLFNAQCEGLDAFKEQKFKRVINFIKKYKEKYDLDSITWIDVAHIEEIKRKIPDIEIHGAIDLMVTDLQKAQYLKEMGFNAITIDRSINTNLKLIKEIKEGIGLKLKILVNSPCIPSCPFRIQHVNITSHLSIAKNEISDNERYKISTVFFNLCAKEFQKNPWYFFNSGFVRPEDLKYYEGIIEIAKIGDRTSSTESILRFIDAYSKRHYDGDLLDLISIQMKTFDKMNIGFPNPKIPNSLIKRLSRCDKVCIKCDYCKDLFMRINPRWKVPRKSAEIFSR